MKKLLIVIIALILASFFFIAPKLLQERKILIRNNININPVPKVENVSNKPFTSIEDMLRHQPNPLSPPVINHVLSTLNCAQQHNVEHNQVLTVIDFSKPSNAKRLWIFDLNEKKLLFNTYVSHGIKSGTLLSRFFSNKYNSKASSLGIYKTEKTYYGRHGPSLQLAGLEPGFNDNASGRAIVMHGGWYVDESFIKRYGRAGRSWGCPAIPSELTDAIINTIKEKSLFVAYYPHDHWLLKSRFLNCDSTGFTKLQADIRPLFDENEKRADVLFASIGHGKREDSEAIVAMSADNYERFFHSKAPLGRMLRRQIANMEYIALSNIEFKNLIASNAAAFNTGISAALNAIYFVVPVVKMERGYAATEMHIVNLGKIKEARLNSSASNGEVSSFTVYFDVKPSITLRATNRFIRWLGL